MNYGVHYGLAPLEMSDTEPREDMSHITGPRMEEVEKVANRIMFQIQSSGLTMGEAKEALHEVDMWIHRLAMRPWEDETCPTCPKDMEKRGDEILAAKAALNCGQSE